MIIIMMLIMMMAMLTFLLLSFLSSSSNRIASSDSDIRGRGQVRSLLPRPPLEDCGPAGAAPRALVPSPPPPPPPPPSRIRAANVVVMAAAAGGSRGEPQEDENRNEDGETDDAEGLILLDGGTGEELFRLGLPDDRTTWSASALVHSRYRPLVAQAHSNFLRAGCDCVTANSYGVVPGAGFSDPTEAAELAALAGRLARRAAREAEEEEEEAAALEEEGKWTEKGSPALETEAGTGNPPLPSSSSASSGAGVAPPPPRGRWRRRRRPPRRVLGSLGPLVESYRPDLVMEHERGVAHYRVLASALAPHVDGFLAETMGSVDEARQALDALWRCSCDWRGAEDEGQKQPVRRPVDCWVSFTLRSDGRLRDGTSVTESLEKLLDLPVVAKADSRSPTEEEDVGGGAHVEEAATATTGRGGVRLSAVLFNCCEPEAITAALDEIHRNVEGESPASSSSSSSLWSRRLRPSGIRLGAYANRLAPAAAEWTLRGSAAAQPLRDDMDPQEYGDAVESWVRRYGVTIVGGCCGITPQHIEHLRERFFSAARSLPAAPASPTSEPR
jgi:S-methylmethionine-dependent homocysteine/selenocysteine methylase